jgi:long-chain acyl-CoA synthetase
MESILLTGGTGFIGTHIAEKLVTSTDQEIFVLVRAKTHGEAKTRLKNSWWEFPELVNRIDDEIFPLPGDVGETHFGMCEEDYARVVTSSSTVLNAAGQVRLDGAQEELRKANVEGVHNLIELCREVQEDHGLKRLAHLSTAYVAGRTTGDVFEDELSGEDGFYNEYEKTKFEGEKLLAGLAGELPLTVFRPGMVVGDSKTGRIRTFNTIYVLIRLYMTGSTRFLPGSPDLPVNLIPVDYVADAVTALTFSPGAIGYNFHLVPPRDLLPKARELAEFVRKWSEENLDLSLPRVKFFPLPEVVREYIRRSGSLPGENESNLLKYFRLFLPYLYDERSFLRDNVNKLYGDYDLNWKDFFPAILDYATRKSFLHRSERTVHQQIYYRLGSRSRPVEINDISGEGVVERDSREVRREILSAAGGLTEMGIGKGDKVCLVGLNSSRYLVLDTAIGLTGSISVPLYYTSPPEEINNILEQCVPKAFFVGAPSVLDRLDELKLNCPTVDFYSMEESGKTDDRTISWGEFLHDGEVNFQSIKGEVSPDDVATIRYTSGTTDKPKGVVFSHANLRWMAENLVSLFPWTDRIKSNSYLSFLPLNHVVEGILGLYSPYYSPGEVEIFFLEGFKKLGEALSHVQPTIFFSVPRFYEHLWERISSNPLYRLYSKFASEGSKNWLARVIRSTVLRKSGLNRCNQLIAGSAPPDPGLLSKFSEIGIEIHNAYGLTEAPLVTMNRRGANKLGTAGTPLPETELKFRDDGEVLVTGPQVTRGYFGDNEKDLFDEGWLTTGDFGYLDDGYLVLSGRKSDVLITSYGKNIHPMKVESRLAGIPGVRHSLLVGDGRPFVCALLWLDEKVISRSGFERIDSEVRNVNRELAHPESVKRWAFLPDDLSISGGELTPNLKVKRSVVLEDFGPVVANLYLGSAERDGVLHVGYAGTPGKMEKVS